MNSRDASGESIARVEDRRIGISECRADSKQVGCLRRIVAQGFHALENLYCGVRPYRPLTQESAVEPANDSLPADTDRERRHQIGDDVVVVACIKGDIGT